MKKFIIGLSTLAVLSVAAAPVVSTYVAVAAPAQQSAVESIEIPVDTVIWGSKGSEHKLADRAVTNGEYKLTVKAVNQDSEHPNTDIIVRSGQSELMVKDVERKAFATETADGSLTVSDGKVTVYVKLGADKVFSGGVKVVLTYVPPEVPPETPPEVPEEPVKPETPEEQPELPNTGPASLLSLLFGGTSIAGVSAHRLFLRYRGRE